MKWPLRSFGKPRSVISGVTIIALALSILFGCSSRPSQDTASAKNLQSLRIQLGKTLFFDKRLSIDHSTSCASCHKPEYGFADDQPFSIGVSGKPLSRHTSHLINVTAYSSFFWDGRAATLEEQALEPIVDPDEMGLPLKELRERLAADPSYQEAFRKAFPNSGNSNISNNNITNNNIATAIADFERSLTVNSTPFHRYQQGDKDALSPDAIKGLALFQSDKTRCSKCHSGPDLTDSDFHNTGLIGEDLGRAAVDRHGNFRMRPYPFFHTQKAFKTPSLLGVANTAPYMHNGSIKTLREVVEIYNRGGEDPESYGLSLDIRPLHLSDTELDQLVTFLREGLRVED